jgi:hypothetical protein
MKNEELKMKNGFVFENVLGYGNPLTSKSLSFAIRILRFYRILIGRTFKAVDFNTKNY